MKSLIRALSLTAVLGFTGLAVASGATGGNCRYICGSTIHVTTSSTCCTQTFTCPDGQTVFAYGYLSPSGWRFCGM
jgi:hypothetical protein